MTSKKAQAPAPHTPIPGFEQAIKRAKEHIKIAEIYASGELYLDAAERLLEASNEYGRAHRIRSINKAEGTEASHAG